MYFFFYEFSRIASPNLIWRNVFSHNTSCTYNCALTYCYGVTNNRINSNENIILYVYLSYAKYPSFRSWIKIVSKYLGTRGYRDIISYIYFIGSYGVN